MHRHTTTHLKTAKGRKMSSTLWLTRQLNDPYNTRAKKEGYSSRAAYKLLEIDDKFNILGHNKIIIDLGAAPGSWTQVTQKHSPKKVIAVDLLPIKEPKGVTFIKGDITDETTLEQIIKALNDQKVDVLLSDIAPNASGHKDIDHLRIINLCEHALELAKETLAPNAFMVLKVFQGGQEKDLANQILQHFFQVKFFKPKATRKTSSEIYLVAIGFIG